MMPSSSRKKALPSYKQGIANALFEAQQKSGASGMGLNEYDIKLFFRQSYKKMSQSWMESLKSVLQDATRSGWLNYDDDTGHYSLDIKLFASMRKHGAIKGFKSGINQHFPHLSSKTDARRRNSNGKTLRRSSRIRSREESQQETQSESDSAESSRSRSASRSESGSPSPSRSGSGSGSGSSYDSDSNLDEETSASSLVSDFARSSVSDSVSCSVSYSVHSMPAILQ